MEIIDVAVLTAGFLCFALAFASVAFSAAYMAHILRRVDESATKTALTETTTSTPAKSV